MIGFESRLAVISKILWDYYVSHQDCLAFLAGVQQSAGYYNEQGLFTISAESLPWDALNRSSSLVWEFNQFYDNGSNNLPKLKKGCDTKQGKLIEEEFLKRMWHNQGV